MLADPPSELKTATRFGLRVLHRELGLVLNQLPVVALARPECRHEVGLLVCTQVSKDERERRLRTFGAIRSYVKVEFGESQIPLVARREQHAQGIDDRGLAGVVWANDDIQPVLEAEAEVFKPPESLDTQFIKVHEPIFSRARLAPLLGLCRQKLARFSPPPHVSDGRGELPHRPERSVSGTPPIAALSSFSTSPLPGLRP